MNKHFTVEVKPNIPGNHQAAGGAAYGAKDVLFDWTAIQVPKGASKLTGITATLRGTDGGAASNGKDFDIVFAKSINNIAPATLGNAGATVSAAPIVANHIIGFAHVDETGGFGNEGFDFFHVCAAGTGAAANLMPNLVLEGEHQSGDNVGYDTIYVGGIVGGAGISFGTTVLVRGAITADNTVTIPTDKGNNDDPNAEVIFAVGDVLETGTGDTVGTVASISAFDTDHQDIILTEKNVEAIANNEELFNVNPIRLILSFEK
tara:strand:- start:41 stop:826 length:786 start_codon:yes stop_codon:yes gene_type:complete